MDYLDFSKCLLLHPGVIRIELLTDDLLKEIHRIEYSKDNIGFMPNDPVGLLEIEKFDLGLILFCSREFPMFTEPFMRIVDSRGTVVGGDIVDSDKEDLDSQDLIWLTNNLYFDISKLNDYDLKCLIGTLALDVEGVPEDIRPRVFYPCMKSAERINEIFGAQGKICATVIVGVNGIEFR